MAEPTTSIVIPAGKIVASIAPGLLARAARIWSGRSVSVFGQPESGKTSFVRFILTGLPADPDESRTVDRKKYGMLVLKIESHGTQREAVLRNIVDRPGQVQGAVHARDFVIERPRHALVFLDASKPFAGKSQDSISGYCENFVSNVLANPKFDSSQIDRIWFVLNKRDLVSEKDAVALEGKLKRFLQKRFLGKLMPAQYRVRTCSLVKDDDMLMFGRTLIFELAAGVIGAE